MTTTQRPRRGGGGRRRRVCLCKEATVNYKEVSLLRRMLTDRGRMESAKKSGNCAKCQRQVHLAIQQARFLGLLPFDGNHLRVTSVISSSHVEDEDEDEMLESDTFDDDDSGDGEDSRGLEPESDSGADDVSDDEGDSADDDVADSDEKEA